MTKTKTLVKKFRNDDGGSMSVELLLVVPILVWALLSTLVYFDAFKSQSSSVRLSMTLADMFSRETEVDSTYINGAHELLSQLSGSTQEPDMRVTVYRYDESDELYYSVWSRNVGDYYTNHTDATLSAQVDRLPILSEGDRGILVETHTDYSAPFSIGIGPFLETDLDDFTFDTFTTIRPRYSTLFCFIQNDGDSVC